jgi:ABC-2 type transport system permease protein
MINLVRSETKRLWARRMTRFFPVGLAALFVAGIAIAYFVITSNDNKVDFVNDIAGGPSASELLGPVSSLLPVMAFVIGASYIGADAKTGMLEQILTWEPRRLRVLGARTVISIVSVGVIAVLLATFLVVLLYGLAAAVGTTDGITGELWANMLATILRTGLAAGLFCAFGLGVSLLINNSVGAIVGFFIYWFIVESFLLSAFLPRVAVYLPVTNASSFGSGRPVERITGGVFSEGGPSLVDDHGYLLAGAILAGWTLVALVMAGVAFRRRDIA